MLQVCYGAICNFIIDDLLSKCKAVLNRLLPRLKSIACAEMPADNLVISMLLDVNTDCPFIRIRELIGNGPNDISLVDYFIHFGTPIFIYLFSKLSLSSTEHVACEMILCRLGGSLFEEFVNERLIGLALLGGKLAQRG